MLLITAFMHTSVKYQQRFSLTLFDGLIKYEDETGTQEAVLLSFKHHDEKKY